MVFVVRRLQEIGRKAGVSLFICIELIDLQKAYDTVDRTLLWQVLTRIEVPPQMIAVIRRFHDGIRAVLMGTKSCTKISILPKIFPTRFRFTFYG